MAKDAISVILTYIKDEIDEHNKLEAIVSKDDRTKADEMINALNKAEGISKADIDRICRVLNYYNNINKGLTFEYGIVFHNGDVWNIEYTSSLRSDRVEGLVNRVTKCPAERYYIVVGDLGITDRSKKRPYKKNQRNICVVSFEEFLDDILYEIYSYDKNGERRLKLSESPQAKINGSRGTMWEKCIAHSLSTRGEFLPNQYSMIMKKIEQDSGFDESDIISVSAKGVGTKKEKTDIEVIIELKNNESKKKCISMKSSAQNMVSLHQAKGSDFINQLGIDNSSKEAEAIKKFEQDGSMKNMTVEQKNTLIQFFEDTKKYEKLIEWAFQGVSGQVDYILLHSYEQDELNCRRNTKIYSLNDYMMKVKAKKLDSGFNTGLVWTYNKKDIQLKVPFVF